MEIEVNGFQFKIEKESHESKGNAYNVAVSLVKLETIDIEKKSFRPVTKEVQDGTQEVDGKEVAVFKQVTTNEEVIILEEGVKETLTAYGSFVLYCDIKDRFIKEMARNYLLSNAKYNKLIASIK